MSNKYDFLLVGAGLFNAIFAKEATKKGKKCLVVDRRPWVGGNLYCEDIENINVHKYGAHIFHTNHKVVWDYMNKLCKFNNYVNSPLANYKDRIFNLPFNMNTFYQLWGTKTPKEAAEKIEQQRLRIENPSNFEEQALSLVGEDIYNTLIKDYTEKQWGQNAKELPAFIIKRIPIRFTYNNNYFRDTYQGIPIGGYNPIFQDCFRDCDVYLNVDFLENRELEKEATTTVFTGMIDQYYDFCYGALEYRSLHFEQMILNMDNYQGNAVVNFTDKDTPYTRVIEHKHFEFGEQKKTVITKEFPLSWKEGLEPYYPINTTRNNALYEKYKKKANRKKSVCFAGRLGSYSYFDMDRIVMDALTMTQKLI